MMAIAVGIHVFVCTVLIVIILIQRGKGGGFVEAFSGLESMLGTKTSAFLSKSTSVLAVVFFLSCLNLAFLSLRESKSLMRSVRPGQAPAARNAAVDAATGGTPEAAGTQPAAQTQPAAATEPPVPQSPAANQTAP
ncbi:MAG: preprotein translocase subunit SecG [Candidatus Omnitrophica bacterium]|nr:preprotein translocase subunit SecG [Candidatus Omnitrophota bacterium]